MEAAMKYVSYERSGTFNFVDVVEQQGMVCCVSCAVRLRQTLREMQ
jgi:hypothetical protein